MDSASGWIVRIAKQTLTLVAAFLVAPAAAPAHTVRVDRASVRTGPSAGAALVTTLPRGSVVKTLLTDSSGSWIAVPRPSNGWVRLSELSDTYHAASETWKFVNTAPSVNVRQTASLTGTPVGRIPWGTPVTVVGTSGSWSQISGPLKGYVYSAYLSPTPPGDGRTRFVTISGLNVRSGAGTTFAVFDRLAWDCRVTVDGTSEGWSKISAPVAGFVSAAYLSTDPPSERATRYVAPSTLNVRSGPGESYPVVGTLAGGAKVTGVRTADAWTRIVSPLAGYAAAEFLSPEPTSTGQKQFVATDSLNLRSAPGGAVLARLPRTTMVSVTGVSNGWAFLNQPLSGYVSAPYLAATSSAALGATNRYVNTPELNVRSGPGSGYARINALARGDRVNVVESRDGWSRIDSPVSGWASAGLLSTYNPDPVPGVAIPASANPYGLPVSPAGFVQLPPVGTGYVFTSTLSRHWGKPRLVYGLIALGIRWNAKSPRPTRLSFGDISIRHGGPISGHATHQVGLDVDILLPRNDGLEGSWGVNRWSAAYSRPLTQALVSEIHDVFDVDVAYFNDAAVYGVSYYPAHDNHIHLRIW